MTTAARFEQVQKRDGRIVAFDRDKIFAAVMKAASAVQGTDTTLAHELTDQVVEEAGRDLERGQIPTVEAIQDAIEKVLIETGHARTAKAFILYRARRSRIREGKSELMAAVGEILGDETSAAPNPSAIGGASAKLYQIGAVASREYHLKRVVPEQVADAHLRGDLHLQDLEAYATSPNAFVLPLDRLLTEGFAVAHGTVRPPRRPGSAAALAALALQTSQNDHYGGQVYAHFDRDFGAACGEVPEAELAQAMEALVHHLNAMHSRGGGQVPFSTLVLGTDTTRAGRAVTRALLEALRRGLGRGEPPVFPNVVFRVQRGVNRDEGDPNADLYALAREVACAGLNPTFAFLDAPVNAATGGETTYYSGGPRIPGDRNRTPDPTHPGPAPVNGRGAVASVVINLPRVALKARRGGQDPFTLLDAVVRLAVDSLRHRLDTLSRLTARDLPFLFGQGFAAGSAEGVASALRHGVLAVGYTGLAEAVHALKSAHHAQTPEAQELGLRLVGRLHEAVEAAAEVHGLNLAVYASTSDEVAGRFPALDRREFGEVPGVTDRPWYTSGHAVPAGFAVSPDRQIAVEAPYHALTEGGHLLALELSEAPTPDQLHRWLEAMADAGCGHGGLNYPLDHCGTCGRRGTFPGDCPCGAPGATLRRIRRLAGYLAPLDRFSPAKRQEWAARSSESRPHA